MELNLNSAVLPKPMIMSPLKTPLKPFIINSAITQIPQIPNPSIEKEKWLTLESNEIYVIRNENINKTNEWIYYKLQREKLLTKRSNPFVEKNEEEKIRGEMNIFKKSFGFTRELFSTATNCKKILHKKQEKIKKTLDSMSKEAKINNISGLKDLEIAKYYMFEMAKENIRKRPKLIEETNNSNNNNINNNEPSNK